MKNKKFFVGYLTVDSDLKKILSNVCILLIVAFFMFSLFFVFFMNLKLENAGKFEFGIEKKWVGVFKNQPIPQIVSQDEKEPKSFLLVNQGKFGFNKKNKHLEGKLLEISGSLIQWKNISMIEVDHFKVVDDQIYDVHISIKNFHETYVLEGEVVDTKCYFGVMNPAIGKVHRACAIRCLSGGVPPGLLVSMDSNHSIVLLLVDEKSQKLKISPSLGGTRVKIEGKIFLNNGVPYLSAKNVVSL